MLKRILLALFVLSFHTTGAFAQDIFVSFDQGLGTGIDGARNSTAEGLVGLEQLSFSLMAM